jgi:NusA-like KH domain protein
MKKTLDMRFIRYLNLFEKIAGVSAKHCFSYNNMIVFVVPINKLSRALGPGARNLKKIGELLGRKIRVVPTPSGREDIQKFVITLIYPFEVRNIALNANELVINAGRQSKAALIGRNRERINEMKKIIEEYFDIKEIRII